MRKTVAYLLLIIPGVVAMIGIAWIRDAFFKVFHIPIESMWLQLFLGFSFFFGGTLFIAGFIKHRDHKL